MARWSMLILAVALAYLITGRLGLLLAVPPGFATAIWPPAGIALGAVLLGGRRLVLGVWLGSFLVNLWSSLEQLGSLSPAVLFLGLTISLGAALQALCGAYLVRRWIGFPITLARERDIVLFLVVAGPLHALVNATVAVLTLSLTGVNPWSRFAINWATWWIGDGIGGMIVAPLLLILFAAPREIWRPRLYAVGIPTLILFGAVVVLFLTSSTWEYATLAIGLTLSGLVGFLLLVVTGRTFVVQEEVTLRTLELSREVKERQQVEDALRQARDELEDRVAERTAELWQSHALLVEEQEQRQQLRDHLAHVARLSTMGEMATGLAHELNQPLAAITNYAGAATNYLVHGAGPEKLTYCLERIQEQALRAGKIIHHLRSFVAGRPTVRVHADVNELVREVLRLLEYDRRTRHTTIELDLADPLPCVLADTVQIQQVLMNLIRNALEAIEPITDRKKVVCVRTSLRPGVVEVAVSDNGPGLAPLVADKLFEAFQSTKPDGLGMGLAISRSLVEAHAGRIGARPNDGQGLTFWFQLPVAQGQ